MSTRRPILILTVSAGAGHVSAARALVPALRAHAPDEDIEFYDLIAHGGYALRRVYGGAYLDLVRRFPAGWGWVYEATDRPPVCWTDRMREQLRVGIQRLITGSFARYLRRRNPQLVINTHFLPAEIVAEQRRRQQLDCQQATVATDFETHRLWSQDPTERYFTPTQRGKAYLVALGATADSVAVTGIPVRAEFEQPYDKQVLRHELGLAPDRPVVLLLSSAGGLAPAELLLQQLIDMRADAQIVAIAGHYRRLEERLRRLTAGTRRSVRVIGFTNEMHRWMHAADIVVTKPGGLTVAEVLVCGAAMAIVNPLPGQELCNNDYLLEHRAAIKVNKGLLLGERVGELIETPHLLRTIQQTARSLVKPHAADRIARECLALLPAYQHLTSSVSPKESVRVPGPHTTA